MADNLNGATTAIFVVALSVAVTEPIDVEWSTKDGTGKAGIDYEAANGVLTFQPGETEKQIQVLVYGRDETAGSSDKTFYIAISPTNNAIVGTALVDCTITVTDAEGTPVTSVIVAQGRRGLRGDPGRSAYEQAVLMGYTGTVQQWMDEIGNAADAAERAENAAATAAAQANAQILPNVNAAQTAATQASQSAATAAEIVANEFDASDYAYATLALAQAATSTLPANTEVKVLKDPDATKNGSYLWNGTTLAKSDYDVVGLAKSYTDGAVIDAIETASVDASEKANNAEENAKSLTNERVPQFNGRSNALSGFITPDGSMPLYIDPVTGRAILTGMDVVDEITVLKNSGSASQQVQYFPDNALYCPGDSLTDVTSSGDWLPKLANDLNWPYYNAGIGGQGSKQIASRAGGVPPLFEAFTIPATTTPVSCVVKNGYSPCSNGGAAQLIKIKNVVGSLARDNSGNHTFTRIEAGVQTAVANGDPGYSVLAEMYSKRVFIIGSGRNSVLAMRPQDIVSTIRSIIDNQRTQVKRVIVWSFPYFPDDSPQFKILVDNINNAIKQAFPEFFVDVKSWLCTTSPELISGVGYIDDPFTVLGITPTSQDLSDISAGLTPVTFRAAVNDGHFNQLSGTAIAYLFKRVFQIRGWI